MRATEPQGRRVERTRRALRRRLARAWRTYWWVADLAAGLVAFGLAYAGWSDVSGGPSSAVDRVYASLALFRFSTLGSPPYPVILEIARWLAPLTAAHAFLRAAGAVFREQWARWWVRLFARDHVIVCGLGRFGIRLAGAFMERGETVVAIDRSPTEEDLAICRDAGIRVIRGNATDVEVLSWARLDRARRLVSVCGNDGVNSEVALRVQASAARRRHPLRCLVHISDEPLCRLLQEAAMIGPTPDLVRLEYFNIYRAGPRALLNAYGSVLDDLGDGPPLIIVAGSGRIVTGLVVEASRRWALERSHPDSRVTMVVLAPNAVAECERLRAVYRDLDSVCDLSAWAAEPSDPDAPPIVAPIDPAGRRGRIVAFVHEDDDLRCLRSTIRVRRALPRSSLVVACTNGRSGLGMLLSGSDDGGLPRVETFELLERLCQADAVLNSDVELMAQAIHARYVRHLRATHEDAASMPAFVPWEALPEHFKEANREQADDIGRKLAAIGYALAPAESVVPRPGAFSADEVEVLARMEHDRWHAEKVREGWRVAATRDDGRRLHPDLVPWDRLGEPDRDKDRQPVRNIPEVLAYAGLAMLATAGARARTPGFIRGLPD